MKQKSLKFNFIMNVILTMSSFIFPLITFPYISRVLLPVGTGKVAFATSLINYFTMFSQLGIPTYGIRACAKVRDNKEELTKVVHELLFINLCMSLVSIAALFFALSIVDRLQDDKLLFVIMSSQIFLTAIGVEWVYKALEQYKYITVRSIIFKLIALIMMFCLVKKQADYVIYGAISIFASSASCILNFFNVHKYIGFKRLSKYSFKRHLKPIFVFFAMACATTIYTNLDTLMLGFMINDAEVGFYNAAVKIKSIVISVVTSLGVVLLPRASYYVEKGLINEFYRITAKALRFVFIISVPLIVYFILYAEEGICFLSGTEYSNSIIPMKVIMPTVFFIGITNILGVQMLIPMGKEKVVLQSEIAGSITDLILNFLLIPQMHSTGAAIGTLAAEFVVFVVQFFSLKDVVTSHFKSLPFFKVLVSLFFGIIASICIKSLSVSYFLKVLISAFIFMGSYGLVLLFFKEPLFIDLINQSKTFLRKNKHH